MTKLCECGCGEPAPIARHSSTKWGWVKGQPMRFVKGHSTRMRGRFTDLSHYTEQPHPDLETPCWVWQGYTNGKYGVLWAAENTGYVHRLSYRQHKGEIPEGMYVCHRCDIPLCMNPDHLFVGTQADNIKDMLSKGRQVARESHWAHKNPERVTGERNGAAKLTEEEVRDIKLLLRSGDFSQHEIATRFGVSRGAICAIATGQTW